MSRELLGDMSRERSRSREVGRAGEPIGGWLAPAAGVLGGGPRLTLLAQ